VGLGSLAQGQATGSLVEKGSDLVVAAGEGLARLPLEGGRQRDVNARKAHGESFLG
jgi:hypothetical protein